MKSRLVMIVALSLFVLWGCGKKQTVEQKEPVAQAQPETKAPEPPALKSLPKLEFKTVYFDFDSYRLNEGPRRDLAEASAVLRERPGALIRLEGHCDERGTIEYNLALGERRANGVREYLMNLGVPGAVLKTLSYGEERPADPGHNEAGWAKNRRVEFVIEKQ